MICILEIHFLATEKKLCRLKTERHAGKLRISQRRRLERTEAAVGELEIAQIENADRLKKKI